MEEKQSEISQSASALSESCNETKKNSEKKCNKRKNKKKAEDTEKNKKKTEDTEKRVIPNYFLGVQISNPQIHQHIKRIQYLTVSREPNLRNALVDVQRAHITLCITKLDTEEDLRKATEAMKNLEEKISHSDLTFPLQIQFNGISTLKNQVLCADIDEDGREVLIHLAKLSSACLEAAGIPVLDKRQYNPHLTILKLSKLSTKMRRNLKKIPINVWKDQCSSCFGVQVLREIQLLSMRKLDEHGYYQRYHSFSLPKADEITESEDHSQCCKMLQSLGLAQEKTDIRRTIHTLTAEALQKNLLQCEPMDESSSSQNASDNIEAVESSNYVKTWVAASILIILLLSFTYIKTTK